jgi:hypothetical protein
MDEFPTVTFKIYPDALLGFHFSIHSLRCSSAFVISSYSDDGVITPPMLDSFRVERRYNVLLQKRTGSYEKIAKYSSGPFENSKKKIEKLCRASEHQSE